MKLNQLTNESEIQLEFSVGKEKLYVEAEIAQVSKSGLVLYPVIVDGKSLSFKNNSNVVNLIYIQQDGKPLIWKNIAISNALLNGKPYVLVRSLEDSREYNRRHNYRLPLDIKGSILGYGDIIIHDISNGGIAFYMDKMGKGFSIGQKVNLGFSARNNNYTISATVARIVESEHRVLYGCTMMSTPLIDQFITEEQRIRIKGF
ncbi:MAG: PilZ domain-containing protein [Lachnospiraceae bacterium]|nr:PilZ domain-containing protein [Lachnospiraceae bacterium]